MAGDAGLRPQVWAEKATALFLNVGRRMGGALRLLLRSAICVFAAGGFALLISGSPLPAGAQQGPPPLMVEGPKSAIELTIGSYRVLEIRESGSGFTACVRPNPGPANRLRRLIGEQLGRAVSIYASGRLLGRTIVQDNTSHRAFCASGLTAAEALAIRNGSR